MKKGPVNQWNSKRMLLDTLKKTQITMKRKGFKVGSKRVREWVQNDNKLIPMKGSCCKLNDINEK